MSAEDDLEEVDFSFAGTAPPAEIVALIEDADARIDAFVEARKDRPLAGFVPSDFKMVYGALSSLAARMDGGCFVEWGSGFGVVTMMAASVGFDAGGIEIQPHLVEAAEALAEDHGFDVEFVPGSFVPTEAQGLIDDTEWPHWLEYGGLDGHDLLDVDPRDIDVVFAYPWPGEANVIESVFDMICDSGALLLTWNGIEEVRLLRKT